jgi:hypothetical protein
MTTPRFHDVQSQRHVPEDRTLDSAVTNSARSPFYALYTSLPHRDASPRLHSVDHRMVLTLCFDAISRNVDGLGYSPFVMFSITSVTKFPASLVILLLQDRVGRKAMASGSLLISGVFTVASGLVIAFVGAKSGKFHTCVWEQWRIEVVLRPGQVVIMVACESRC